MTEEFGPGGPIEKWDKERIDWVVEEVKKMVERWK